VTHRGCLSMKRFAFVILSWLSCLPSMAPAIEVNVRRLRGLGDGSSE
jgi:hypothetical protein